MVHTYAGSSNYVPEVENAYSDLVIPGQFLHLIYVYFPQITKPEPDLDNQTDVPAGNVTVTETIIGISYGDTSK